MRTVGPAVGGTGFAHREACNAHGTVVDRTVRVSPVGVTRKGQRTDRAASSMTSVTLPGCDTLTAWDARTSVVWAPARSAMNS